ncbi:Serine/threonine-protein kinase wnk1, partial [Lunasporangiospora selenospora]
LTKEYPYAECTNQAQIFRKVSQGIKPQALEQIQDVEVREFVNRCLDHDPNTRPSAEALLESEFLKPCAALACTPVLQLQGLETNPLAHMTLSTSQQQLSSLSLSSAPALARSMSTASSVGALSMVLPPIAPVANIPSTIQPTRLQTAAPAAVVLPVPGAIPAAEFTLTTVDVDNKTYHIKSNLLPPTPSAIEHQQPIFPVPGPSGPTADSAPMPVSETTTTGTTNELATTTTAVAESASEASRLHSHSGMPQCSIQVLQCGDSPSGDRLNLKMICTCPVTVAPGSTGAPAATGTHEIKFPFDLAIDTADDVVAEMIREQILSSDDKDEATCRLGDLIEQVLLARREKARKEQEEATLLLAKATAAATRPRAPSSPRPTPVPTAIIERAKQLQAHGQKQKQSSALKKTGHHRHQLNIPPLTDLEQYRESPSPTESRYDIHQNNYSTSAGSNSSFSWISAVMSNPSNVETSESQWKASLQWQLQQPQQQPQQSLPLVSDAATFPPLQTSSHSGMARKEATHPPTQQPWGAGQSGNHSSTAKSLNYSTAVQHQSTVAAMPTHEQSSAVGGFISRGNAGWRSPPAPRPKSVYSDVNYLSSSYNGGGGMLHAGHLGTPGAGSVSPMSMSDMRSTVSEYGFRISPSTIPSIPIQQQQQQQQQQHQQLQLPQQQQQQQQQRLAPSSDLKGTTTEDVGYTSPYRHGVSSSSVKSHRHRRSPSCEVLSSLVAQSALAASASASTPNIPASLRLFSGLSLESSPSGSNTCTSPNPRGSGAGRVAPFVPTGTSATATSPRLQATLLGRVSSPQPLMAAAAVVAASSVQATPIGGMTAVHTTALPATTNTVSVGAQAPVTAPTGGTENKDTALGRSDSGISSGASSPASTTATMNGGGQQPSQAQYPPPAVMRRPSAFSGHRTYSGHGSHGFDHDHDHDHDPYGPLSLGMWMMTSEAKKNIEMWSDKVRTATPEFHPLHPHQRKGHGDHELTDDDEYHFREKHENDEDVDVDVDEDEDDEDEEMDEDLKGLREKQRRELEWMRLQHEIQWEEMMRMKDFKEKNELHGLHGPVMRVRRASEAYGVLVRSASAGAAGVQGGGVQDGRGAWSTTGAVDTL